MKKYLLSTAVILLTLTACTKDPSKVEPAVESSEAIIEDMKTQELAVQEYIDSLPKEPAKAVQLEKIASGEEIATVTTNMGSFKLRFFPEYAPLAVENFKELAKSGYYNNIIFHRVINNFMIQAGDPTGTGTGGESHFGDSFADEFSYDLHNIRGSVAMANSGPNTNGSQFFINQNNEIDSAIKTNLEKTLIEFDSPIQVVTEDFSIKPELFINKAILEYYINEGGNIDLDNNYTVFAQVFDGMDVVDAISGVEIDTLNTQENKPLKDVIIEKVEFSKYTELE